MILRLMELHSKEKIKIKFGRPKKWHVSFPNFQSPYDVKRRKFKDSFRIVENMHHFFLSLFFFLFLFSHCLMPRITTVRVQIIEINLSKKKKLELLLCWDCTKIVGINWNFNLSHELSYTLTQRILKRRPIPKSDSRPKCIRHEWNTWGAQSPPLCFNWWQ